MGAQLLKKGYAPQFSAHVYCGQMVAHLSYCGALANKSADAAIAEMGDRLATTDMG